MGVSKLSVEKFSPRGAERGRRGSTYSFLCFGYRKKCFRGLFHDFVLKIFCLTVPENFVAEPFILPLSLRIEIIYALKGYVRIFCRKFFVSKYRNVS